MKELRENIREYFSNISLRELFLCMAQEPGAIRENSDRFDDLKIN